MISLTFTTNVSCRTTVVLFTVSIEGAVLVITGPVAVFAYSLISNNNKTLSNHDKPHQVRRCLDEEALYLVLGP